MEGTGVRAAPVSVFGIGTFKKGKIPDVDIVETIVKILANLDRWVWRCATLLMLVPTMSTLAPRSLDCPENQRLGLVDRPSVILSHHVLSGKVFYHTYSYFTRLLPRPCLSRLRPSQNRAAGSDGVWSCPFPDTWRGRTSARCAEPLRGRGRLRPRPLLNRFWGCPGRSRPVAHRATPAHYGGRYNRPGTMTRSSRVTVSHAHFVWARIWLFAVRFPANRCNTRLWPRPPLSARWG